MHPSLLTRIILTAIILPTLTILTILPLHRFQHAFLRFSLSAVGAFGIVLSISLLAHVEGWADVWERFYVRDGEWGSSSEKGLSAAYCFFLAGGMGCDWVLRYKFGENPDQKWDSYLVTYSQNLPDRAGTFQPLTSIWSRLFGLRKHTPVPNEIDFPTDEDLKSQIPTRMKLQKRTSISKSSGGLEFQTPPAYLKKGRLQQVREKAGKRTRDPVKFGGDLFSSGSDSEEEELKTPLGLGRPLLDRRKSSSLGFAGSLRKIRDVDIDVEKELAKVKMGLGAHHNGNLDYSDFEEDDVTSAAIRKNRDSPGWSPDFLRRHQDSGGTSTTSQRTVVEYPSPVLPSTPTPEGAVPMTLSLIKAIDRIAVAQRAAFGATGKLGFPRSKSSDSAGVRGLPRAQVYSPSPFSGGEQDKSAGWDAFWRDVQEKAAHAR
jgi:hypothetical protein